MIRGDGDEAMKEIRSFFNSRHTCPVFAATRTLQKRLKIVSVNVFGIAMGALPGSEAILNVMNRSVCFSALVGTQAYITEDHSR